MQASKVDRGQFDKWAKQYGATFTPGMINGDQDKTRFAWGVEALPWFVLADNEQVVQAEGFGIGELDEKVRALRTR